MQKLIREKLLHMNLENINFWLLVNKGEAYENQKLFRKRMDFQGTSIFWNPLRWKRREHCIEK
jgi:hypothetical protein